MPGGGVDRGVVPHAAAGRAGEGEHLAEHPVAQPVLGGDRGGRRVEGIALVDEGGGHRSRSLASRAKRPHGASARWLKYGVPGPVTSPVARMLAAGTPASVSTRRLAATRSNVQWPGPSGVSAPASPAAEAASATSSPTW